MNARLDLQTKAKEFSTAIAEVFAVCGLYIALAHAAVSIDLFGVANWFKIFSPAESQVAIGFTNGALAQLALVIILIGVPFFSDARQALWTCWQSADQNGWTIALWVLVVEVVALYLGWIKDFGKLIDTSAFAISMSLIPAFDGVTQEIVFRGYVILRLARGGASRLLQILLSGMLFAAIHFSYVTGFDSSSIGSIAASLMPIIGTFGLGAAWAFAFQQSGYKLLPVVVSHVLVIVLTQPWLAMIYAP